jgi:glucose/mannose-6-phosphate isomerase
MDPVIDESRLDDERLLAEADPAGTLVALAGAGAQVRMARSLATEAGVDRIALDGRPRAVVVAALAGSAVVGELLVALGGPGSPVPVSVVHSSTLPGWVSPLDLVVAVSLSGRASGPLAVAAEAARRGCRLLTVGREPSPLAHLSVSARGVHVPVPEGLRSSRAGLWALAVPVLGVADDLELVHADAGVLEATADRLDEVAGRARPSSESFVNPAKSLAVQLAGSVPLVLGAGDLIGAAASRAAAQLARNAGHPAVPGVLPDAAGGIVAIFDGPFSRQEADIFADPYDDGPPASARLRLLLMRDSEDAEDDRIGRIANVVRDTATESGVSLSEVRAEPGPALARVAGLIALTDFASVYLALGLGMDPANTPHVIDLKERMA